MIKDTLNTLFPFAGWPESRAGEVEISGGYDPILATPFRITETAVASLAAVGLAASDLWEMRTGRRQTGSVNTRQATASLRSGFYLKMGDTPVPNGRNVVMGTHMGAEGAQWIGMAPFTETEHIFQNIGDGTYAHSGSLAIRYAASVNAHITFKLLRNAVLAHRRIDGGELRLHNHPRPLINNLPLLSRTVAERGNGTGEQRKVIGHAIS